MEPKGVSNNNNAQNAVACFVHAKEPEHVHHSFLGSCQPSEPRKRTSVVWRKRRKRREKKEKEIPWEHSKSKSSRRGVGRLAVPGMFGRGVSVYVSRSIC